MTWIFILFIIWFSTEICHCSLYYHIKKGWNFTNNLVNKSIIKLWFFHAYYYFFCRFLECEPTCIDASWVSAQHRERLFWGNIPGLSTTVILDRNVKLDSFLEKNLARTSNVDKIRTVTTSSNSMIQGEKFKTKNRKRKGKSCQRMRDLWTKGTHKYMETWHHLYIYSLLIEKDICHRQNVKIKLPCVGVCHSPGDLFIFSIRLSSLFTHAYEGSRSLRTNMLYWNSPGVRKKKKGWILYK